MVHLTEEDVKNRYITPALTSRGWTLDQMRMERAIRPNFEFTDGKVIIKGNKARRGTPLKADYVLHHHNHYPIAVVEAKNMGHQVGDGIQQAMQYASLLDVPFAYTSNGKGFVEYDFILGKQKEISLDAFPTCDELWERLRKGKGYTAEVEKVIKEPYYFREGGV